MKRNLIAWLMAIGLSATGCAGMILQSMANQGELPSREKIEAIEKLGGKFFMCGQVSGPPPSGAVIWIIVPKDSNPNFTISDGCHLLPFASRP